jgi:hypothetical protein
MRGCDGLLAIRRYFSARSFSNGRKGLMTGRILWVVVVLILCVFILVFFYLVGWKLLQKLFVDMMGN